MKILFGYWLCISIVAAFVTAYDKYASRHRRRHRVPENTLLFLAAIGGAAAMYLTMLLIRHKTKHKRFMLGLPCLLMLQVAVVLGLLWFFRWQ